MTVAVLVDVTECVTGDARVERFDVVSCPIVDVASAGNVVVVVIGVVVGCLEVVGVTDVVVVFMTGVVGLVVDIGDVVVVISGVAVVVVWSPGVVRFSAVVVVVTEEDEVVVVTVEVLVVVVVSDVHSGPE